MRKFIYTFIKTSSITFIAFGLVGLVVYLSIEVENKVFGLSFYTFWVAIGLLGYCKIKKYKRLQDISAFEKLSTDDINMPYIHQLKESKDIESFSHLANQKTEPGCTVPSYPNLPFPNTYLVIDVETPNRKNESISQIGLILYENGIMKRDFSSLINPQEKFDQINIKLTGIDANKVARAPILNDYWDNVSNLIEGYIIVGHNISFDLEVLHKALAKYHIDMPEVKYVCTLDEMRNKYPDLESYSLEKLCQAFDVDSNKFHDAKNDCCACSALLQILIMNKNQVFPKSKSFIKVTNDKNRVPSQMVENIEVIKLPYDDPDNIDYSGKFVLTGVFTDITKNEIAEIIESRGGKIQQAISSKTNFIIVGNQPEPAWKFGGYGTKINKALQLKKDSYDLSFISESHFVKITHLLE